jgi:hypothetical protein
VADNVAITAGSGTTVATDDVSGTHYQRVKLVDGTLDSSTAIPGDGSGLYTQSVLERATFVVKTVDFTASQTAQSIWTPGSGKKFVVCDVICSASAAGAITIFDATDSTTYRVAKLNLAANGGAVMNYTKPYVSAAANNVLKYTTGTGAAGSLTVSGYEV